MAMVSLKHLGEEREHFHGGKADGKASTNYPKEQIQKGIQVEMEHTDDPAKAREIAKDHLEENRKYYDHLEKMEKKMEKNAFIQGFEKAASKAKLLAAGAGGLGLGIAGTHVYNKKVLRPRDWGRGYASGGNAAYLATKNPGKAILTKSKDHDRYGLAMMNKDTGKLRGLAMPGSVLRRMGRERAKMKKEAGLVSEILGTYVSPLGASGSIPGAMVGLVAGPKSLQELAESDKAFLSNILVPGVGAYRLARRVRSAGKNQEQTQLNGKKD